MEKSLRPGKFDAKSLEVNDEVDVLAKDCWVSE
jgi:hypothetical protein